MTNSAKSIVLVLDTVAFLDTTTLEDTAGDSNSSIDKVEDDFSVVGRVKTSERNVSDRGV